MSARTLQRRLTDADITFQQLVEDTRRELAHHYLKQSTVESNETAFLLGYETEERDPGSNRARLAAGAETVDRADSRHNEAAPFGGEPRSS